METGAVGVDYVVTLRDTPQVTYLGTRKGMKQERNRGEMEDTLRVETLMAAVERMDVKGQIHEGAETGSELGLHSCLHPCWHPCWHPRLHLV